MSTGKGRRGKRGTKVGEKIFQMKEERNIYFHYLQVLVLVITEMQMQL